MIADNKILFPANNTGVPRQKKFFNTYLNDTQAIVTSLGCYSTEAGTKSFIDIFNGKKVFDNTKPITLIEYIVNQSTNEKDLVLDFFAGSGTTAHAVLAQNTADGGKRNFILVQFPEVLNPESTTQKTASEFCDSIGKPLTIAEVTKERVRRAAAKIRNEHPMFAGDLGFSSYKLAPSHIVDLPKTIVNDPSQVMNLLFHERLVTGWTADGLYAELLLREGFALTTPYTTIGDWRCYVHDNEVSLYLNVTQKTSATELLRVLEVRDRDGKRKRNGVAICLDGALTNAELQHLHEHVFLKTV